MCVIQHLHHDLECVPNTTVTVYVRYFISITCSAKIWHFSRDGLTLLSRGCVCARVCACVYGLVHPCVCVCRLAGGLGCVLLIQRQTGASTRETPRN